MSATDAHSTELFDKFYRYYSHLDDRISGDDVRGLFDSIKDKAWLDNVLSKYDESITEKFTPEKNAGLFQYSTPAGLVITSFLFYAHLILRAPVIQKRFEGDTGGLGLTGFYGSGGKLYYDDINDLVGESDIECNFVSFYADVNFIRRGHCYATYQGGGMALEGIFGGKGKWENWKRA